VTKTWILLVLAACGGSAATTTGGTSTTVSNTMAPSGPDVHRSRHTVVRKAVAAMASGDVEGLVALASPKELYARHYTCSTQSADQFEATVREAYSKATTKAKGVTVEVVAIEQLKLQDPKSRDEKCGPKKSLAIHSAKVRVKLGQDAKARERRLDFTLFEVDDRWYLGDVPDLSGKTRASEAIDMVMQFSDRMCNCKDKACADKVNDDYTKWGSEMAKNARPEDARDIDPDDIKRMTEAATKYSECYTKLAMAGSGNP
jgi:hypothetical protein